MRSSLLLRPRQDGRRWILRRLLRFGELRLEIGDLGLQGGYYRVGYSLVLKGVHLLLNREILPGWFLFCVQRLSDR